MSKKVYGLIQYIDKIQRGELRIDQILSHYDYRALSSFVSVNCWDDIPSVIEKIDGRLQDIKDQTEGRFEIGAEDILKSIKKRLVKLVKESEND